MHKVLDHLFYLLPLNPFLSFLQLMLNLKKNLPQVIIPPNIRKMNSLSIQQLFALMTGPQPMEELTELDSFIPKSIEHLEHFLQVLPGLIAQHTTSVDLVHVVVLVIFACTVIQQEHIFELLFGQLC